MAYLYLAPLSNTNTIELLGDNVPTHQDFGETPASRNFDVISKANKSYENAGKYTYTPPTIGDDPQEKGTKGVYNYINNDGFDYASTDRVAFYDTSKGTGIPCFFLFYPFICVILHFQCTRFYSMNNKHLDRLF